MKNPIKINAVVGKSFCLFSGGCIGICHALGSEGNSEVIWGLRKLIACMGDQTSMPIIEGKEM